MTLVFRLSYRTVGDGCRLHTVQWACRVEGESEPRSPVLAYSLSTVLLLICHPWACCSCYRRVFILPNSFDRRVSHAWSLLVRLSRHRLALLSPACTLTRVECAWYRSFGRGTPLLRPPWPACPMHLSGRYGGIILEKLNLYLES